MGVGGTIVVLILSLVFGRNFVNGTSPDQPAPQQSASGDVA